MSGVRIPRSPFRLALIGAGRVGIAVAELLRRRGHEIVGVASRSPSSADQAAQRLGTTTFPLHPADLPDADVVLLATPDTALPGVVRACAAGIRPGAVLWHVSGASGLEPLRAATARKVHGCAVHPMQACPTVDAAIENLPGSAWGITVTDPLRDWAHRLVRDDLNGIPVDVAEEHRALWHAASITTSTGINAVLALGETLLDDIGVHRPDEVLRPLIAGTLQHSFKSGGAHETITGPVVRGESETVERHLGALRASSNAGTIRDYLVVAQLALERAAVAGRVGGDTAHRMRELLRAARGE